MEKIRSATGGRDHEPTSQRYLHDALCNTEDGSLVRRSRGRRLLPSIPIWLKNRASQSHDTSNSAPCTAGHGRLSPVTADQPRSINGASLPSSAGNPLHSTIWNRMLKPVIKFSNFIGPGAMVSVAYIDPGNYATDIAAGATYQFKLLFIVLLANVFAIFLQNLCIKLGSVTGLNLAQMIKLHCPPWLNYLLYVFAEAAIIATDIAEVIGTAIALNLLFKLPLVAGCIISIFDVLIILFFYRPGKSMRGVRVFEVFALMLVLGVVVCFCYQLSLLQNTSVGDVFKGYLPSSALVQSQGLYQACGVLGATVMPHSLYLGSGTCQPRLLHFDKLHGRVAKSVELEGTTRLGPVVSSDSSDIQSSVTEQHEGESPAATDSSESNYTPSLAAIKHCLRMSTVELTVCLLTFALFVNSAILIVAGASLYDPTSESAAADASLFQIHRLLSDRIGPSAGILFALALLLSGTSAGIVCTIAGQMVSEAQLAWRIKPWIRRLLTRSLSITPSVIIAGAVGAPGLTRALEASQVVLCFCLPAVMGPLVWFTARASYLSVKVGPDGERITLEPSPVRPHRGAASEQALTEPSDPAIATLTAQNDSTASGVRVAKSQATSSNLYSAVSAASRELVTTTPMMIHDQARTVHFHNHWATTIFAVLVWLLIVVMNMTTIVLLGIAGGLQ